MRNIIIGGRSDNTIYLILKNGVFDFDLKRQLAAFWGPHSKPHQLDIAAVRWLKLERINASSITTLSPARAPTERGTVELMRLI